MGTYHDGERRGVHCRAEYEAEDDVEHTKTRPTFWRIIKNKDVEEFKSDPYLATLLNCML